MYFETLCIEGGQALRLPFHQWRIDSTLAACGGPEVHPSLASLLAQHDLSPYQARTRCRVDYAHDGFHSIVFSPYTPRPLHSLRLLPLPEGFDYGRKLADRQQLDALHAQRGTCSDVLLLRQNFLTDTTTANIALFDGQDWYTPTRPLLPGTHRVALVAEGILRERALTLHDLPHFSHLRLLNALLHWGELEMPTTQLIWD